MVKRKSSVLDSEDDINQPLEGYENQHSHGSCLTFSENEIENPKVDSPLNYVSVTPTSAQSARSSPQLDHETKEDQHADIFRPNGHGYIQAGAFSYPRSAYQGWEPPLPRTNQDQALAALVASGPIPADDGLIYFELSQFSVYRPDTGYNAGELVCLSKLLSDGFPEFVFDGILSSGNDRRYVQGLHFRIMAVEYSESPVMYIQTEKAKANGIWFQLGKPSPEYQRFHAPFVWLAEFCGHFIEYLSQSKSVCLDDFRSRFHEWLCEEQRDESLSAAGLQDYRSTVNANQDFLWKEWHSINQDEVHHPIWDEVNFRIIPQQPVMEEKTIVTPATYRCFPEYLQKHMQPREISDPSCQKACAERKEELGLTPLPTGPYEPPTAQHLTYQSLSTSKDVSPGDVVYIEPCEEGPWLKSTSENWYAYVQDKRIFKTATTKSVLLDVIWLYGPSDTTIGEAPYPYPGELFFSDNCGCGDSAIDITAITGKISVNWSCQNPEQERGFFVRQKFRTVAQDNCYDFVSICKDDFKCNCKRTQPSDYENCKSKYSTGDTVLMKLRNENLVPAWIQRFDDQTEVIEIRRAIRTNAASNELLCHGSDLMKISPSSIVRRCHFQIFGKGEKIPAPYDRDGAGDFYYMRRDPYTLPHAIKISHGQDPSHDDKSKMRGLAMFCGGGNFDRGIEEGNAVQVEYAIDWSSPALHTHRANALHDDCKHYLGSTNDYLAAAMAGSEAPIVAPVGGVRVIIAGSPCQGFSNMNNRKSDEKARKNASMVASVVSFMDLYCPEYLVFENVCAMSSIPAGETSSVFSHTVAALVAMGYQVQQFLIEAWAVGSSQSRARLFIIASAPGLPPLKQPPQTHSRPPTARQQTKALGKLSSGLPFASCQYHQAPLMHVSAAQATRDLPSLYETPVQLCPEYPDHKTSIGASSELRNRMASVPILPRGMNLAKAGLEGLLYGEPLQFLRQLQEKKAAKAKLRGKTMMTTLGPYQRVNSNGLFPTITTAISPADERGTWVHWEENRVLSVMEIRRAVGYPDHEVIIGSPAKQVAILGNSVDRKAALSLGLSLRASIFEARERDLLQ